MTKKIAAREGASFQKTFTLNCPTCGKPTVFSPYNECRPFCSRQCKTGDLAAWASDEYKLATNERAGDGSDEDRPSTDSEDHE